MDYESEGLFRQAHPDLPWITPDSSSYAKRREIYRLNNTATPRAIVLPQNAEDVAAIIRMVRKCKIPVTVRTGGHDIYGQSVVQDAICIDMRDIDFLEISSDRKTAKIGGGILMGYLLESLEKEGLVTPCGAIPGVGYFGWASLAGYGPMGTNWGLGVDQIVEVDVVNAKGDIVSAGPDLLTGLRGSGGKLGVAVSLRIKVYELKTVGKDTLNFLTLVMPGLIF